MVSTNMVNDRPPRASLLGVPSEVRLNIYRSLFEDSRIKIHFFSEVDSDYQDPWRRIELDSYAQSMTQTCRVLRAESLPVLHDATTLGLCAARDDLLKYNPYQFLRSLSQTLLQHIQHLSVDRMLVGYVPLGKLTKLKTLKVTGVVCIRFRPLENALARDEEGVRAIESVLRHKDTYYYHVNRVRGQQGQKDRRYKLLCESSLFHFRNASPGPCLRILFNMDSGAVVASHLGMMNGFRHGCDECRGFSTVPGA